jgi:hypothetical protein
MPLSNASNGRRTIRSGFLQQVLRAHDGQQKQSTFDSHETNICSSGPAQKNPTHISSSRWDCVIWRQRLLRQAMRATEPSADPNVSHDGYNLKRNRALGRLLILVVTEWPQSTSMTSRTSRVYQTKYTTTSCHPQHAFMDSHAVVCSWGNFLYQSFLHSAST